jgi:hypothetical protein
VQILNQGRDEVYRLALLGRVGSKGEISMANRSTSRRRAGQTVSRRQFGATAGIAVIGTGLVGMGLLDKPRGTFATIGQPVAMGDPANPTMGYFVRPQSGKHPGVVTWRSGEAMTEADRDAARELSAKGYAVVVIDRGSGDAASAFGDTRNATWFLKNQQQVNMDIGIGTPKWAEYRLEPVRRV